MTAAKKLSPEVRERPILFSGPMVRAILEGRKHQTRRIFKFRKPTDHLLAAMPNGEILARCPYGRPGERLWVKETWAIHECGSRVPLSPETWDGGRWPVDRLRYLATDPELAAKYVWTRRPSLFMPRWASRITLEVTEVRVERLQDISEEDAKAEGAFFTDYGKRCFHDWSGPGPCPAPQHHMQKPGWSMVETASDEECLGSARMAFANLWNRINGEDAWDANPFVWVVNFRPAGALQGVGR